MTYAIGLRCRKCGREYPLQAIHICDFCLSPLEVSYDYKAISKVISRDTIARGPTTIWRYRHLLPVNSGEATDIGTGFTPLVKADNLGEEIGLEKLYIKNDCLNPTYSFKDRAVSVAVNKAKELNFDTVACASTGNLAASVAAYAAKAKMKAYVFVPAGVEAGKLTGIAVYKPIIVTVDGSYDDVNRLCAELSHRYSWGFINVNLRPYYAEGSKTISYEICEQLGWQAPDCILAPAGSGLLFTRLWKGLQELSTLDLIGPVNTHMFVLQAQGSSPIVHAFEAGNLHVHPVKANTIVSSIAIGNPADGYYALMTARGSGGGAVSVTDDEAIEGVLLLAQTEGIFAEAAGGVVIAGLKKLVSAGVIEKHHLTVAVITGAGPRTQETITHPIKPFTVWPSVESFEEVLGFRTIDIGGI